VTSSSQTGELGPILLVSRSTPGCSWCWLQHVCAVQHQICIWNRDSCHCNIACAKLVLRNYHNSAIARFWEGI
jgi:hypothetical protein